MKTKSRRIQSHAAKKSHTSPQKQQDALNRHSAMPPTTAWMQPKENSAQKLMSMRKSFPIQNISQIPKLPPSAKYQTHQRATITNVKVSSNRDDVFFSGGWLFDLEGAPQWFLSEYMPKKAGRTVKRVFDDNDNAVVFSGAWLFRLHEMPMWFQREVALPLTAQPITHMHFTQLNPDDGFYSGAWLFDTSAAPFWLLPCILSSSHVYHPLVHFAKKRRPIEGNRMPSSGGGPPPEVYEMGGTWLFDLASAPDWFRLIVDPSHCTTTSMTCERKLSGFSFHTMTQRGLDQVVHLHPLPIQRLHAVADENTGFYSGAWLFDLDAAPEWLKCALHPTSQSKEKSLLPLLKNFQKQCHKK